MMTPAIAVFVHVRRISAAHIAKLSDRYSDKLKTRQCSVLKHDNKSTMGDKSVIIYIIYYNLTIELIMINKL